VNITSSTFAFVTTSNLSRAATLQCLAACQSTDGCEFWTVDPSKRICELKQSSEVRVRAISANSGSKVCRGCGENVTVEFGFGNSSFDASIDIFNICSEDFILEVESDHLSHADSSVKVYVDDVDSGMCELANGDTTTWISCGSFETIFNGSLSLRIESGSNYSVKSRITYVAIFDGSFIVAPSCPNTTYLRECSNAGCGHYCFANETLPDGNSNFAIENCVTVQGTFSV
jgi:hypothetical protein